MEHRDLAEKALKIAEELQYATLKHSNNSQFSKRLKPMLNSPKAKAFLIKMLDIAFRSESLERIAKFTKQHFDQSDVFTPLFTFSELQLIRLFQLIGHKFPSISIPIMRNKIAEVSENMVFVHYSPDFEKHAEDREGSGISLNINLIGEALLGEREARERLVKYRMLLNEKHVNYISIKISTIYSQIDTLAYEETLQILKSKLSLLYMEVVNIHAKTGEWKFINLDMEEYRDLSLTVDTFIATLSEPEFKNLRAGIVLQAYIPDSYNYLLKLQSWASKRVALGGAPIKIRIVKGANMEMEKTEASLQNWNLVTYEKKIETDANYKKMLISLLHADSCKSIHVGVASHNIFDIAFAFTLVKDQEIAPYVEFEMLEGMAGHLPLELIHRGYKVLLYTPLVEQNHFMTAIAYLVRRLDEGTANGNFLKEGFELKPDTPKWKELENNFLQSLELMPIVDNQPKRKQNRNKESIDCLIPFQFSNEPDTDWTIQQNRNWILHHIKKTKDPSFVFSDAMVKCSIPGKNRQLICQNNWNGPIPWQYELATTEDYDFAINAAKSSSWLFSTAQRRVEIIREAAKQLKIQRGNLIGVGVKELGKLVKELDAEISEAIDFANYYASLMEIQTAAYPEVNWSGKGTNLVLSPWNFPIAIPAGGIIASLVSGNTVILKPSLNAAACSLLVCQCLWNAGIPKDALFFLPAEEKVLDKYLSSVNFFDAVILTGGTETARFLLERNPYLPLYAETGGKNATIVTALADRDQAIKNVIHSAFSNSGQKCSATSLLILEEEVFNDNNFKNLLKDAVLSKKVGSPQAFDSQIGPLLVAPNNKIKNCFLKFPDEKWLVKPEINGNFVSPGILWDITTSDFEYKEELFGPILFVMKAKDLDEAIEIANGVPYGLTSGLESLDEAQIEYWKNRIEAGNLYINRPTTGAIVERQPFGGIKASCFGFGMKAGGPHYLLQFQHCKSNKRPETTTKVPDHNLSWLNENVWAIYHQSLQDYSIEYENHFKNDKSMQNIRGQYNILHYIKPREIKLFADVHTPQTEIAMVVAACLSIHCSLEIISVDDLRQWEQFSDIKLRVTKLQSWSQVNLSTDIHVKYRALNKDRLPLDFIKTSHKKAIHLYGDTPSPLGRVELLNYLTEQSISHNFHRYGNLMGKDEPVE